MKSVIFYGNNPRMIHSSENHSFNNYAVKSYFNDIRKGLLGNLRLRLKNTALFQCKLQKIDKSVPDKILHVISNYWEEKQKIENASDQQLIEMKSHITNDNEISGVNENPVSKEEAEKILRDSMKEEGLIQGTSKSASVITAALRSWVKDEAYQLISKTFKNVELDDGMNEAEINQAIKEQFDYEVKQYGASWAGFFVRKIIASVIHNATMFIYPKPNDNAPVYKAGYGQYFSRETTTKGMKKLETHLNTPSQGYKGDVEFQVLMNICETNLTNKVNQWVDDWFGSDSENSKQWQQVLDKIEEPEIIESKKDLIGLVEELSSMKLDLDFSSQIDNRDKNHIKKMVKEEYEIIENAPGSNRQNNNHYSEGNRVS